MRGASAQPICTPEKRNDEDHDYQNVRAMSTTRYKNTQKKRNIQIAITMPVDTLADRLFPFSTLLRILKGSAKDGTVKVKRREVVRMFPMLVRSSQSRDNMLA